MTPLLMTPLIEFLAPHRLWWLLLVPAIGLVYLALSSRLRTGRGGIRTRLDRVIPRDKPWKRHLSVALALASLASLVVAYSMPKAYSEVPRDRATIVVTIDISESMTATDVAPTRLEAEKVAATAFVQSLPPRFNVSLVTFAGVPVVKVPPTTDRGTVIRAIADLDTEPSTAIGEAIYKSLTAVKLAPPDPKHPDEVAPAAIVLLSDGSTNTGKPSYPAAQEAKKQGVPIYTIAYGTDHGYVVENGQQHPVPVNHAELRAIAQASGGKAYAAASSSQLSEVYSTIAKSVGTERVYVEVTEKYAGLALLFAILAALGVISLGARWP